MSASILAFSWLLVTLPAEAGSLEDAVAAIPDPHRLGSGWVYDEADVTLSRRGEINTLISGLERDTSAEIGVAIVKTIGDEVPKEFATALYNHWGVGKEGRDNGVLVLHVLDQRRVEIEVGYGLEAVVSDARAGQILDEQAIPAFREDRLADGHYGIVSALDRDIRAGVAAGEGGTSPSPAEVVQRSTLTRFLLGIASFLPAVAALVLAVVWSAIFLVLGRFSEPYRIWRAHRYAAWAEYPLFAAGTGYGCWSAGLQDLWVLAPVGVVVGLSYALRSLVSGWLRGVPRKCAKCAQTMDRLDDTADDAWLQPGQVTEERIQSVEYDVWQCACGEHRVDRYQWVSSFSRCPSCGNRTYKRVSSQVVSAPTYTSSGTREVVHACSHCNHRGVTRETIPRLQRSTPSSSSSRSSSSSSRSSSSSSRSSFGGGRSGGGGAGRSY